MILQSLKDLALREQLLTNPDFEPKEVAWIITVGDGGSFLGLSRTVTETRAGTKQRGKKMLVPRQSGRTSGREAEFLVDKSEYVLGIEPDGKRQPEELKARQELFASKAAAAAGATGVPSLAAVRDFLNSREETTKCIAALGSEYKSNDLFAFSHVDANGSPVHLDPAVMKHWSALRRSDEANLEQCLLCGNLRPPVEKHPAIRKLPGGSTSGVSLVSFNEDAFESLGLSRNENAPVCRDCADAYTTALNRCLDSSYPSPVEEGKVLGRRNVRLSENTAAVFWGGREGELVDLFAAILEGSDQEAVRALLGSPYKGRPLQIDSSRFFALILSGAQGRATLHGTHIGTVEGTAQNLATYFKELDITPSGPLPLWRLLECLSALGDRKNLPPNLAGSLFLSAVSGVPFPQWIYTAAVGRARAEASRTAGPVPRERAAIIKAFLNRNLKKEVKVALDKDNPEPGYRLGRLFAVLENLQSRAIRNISATITDRYYGAASTRPQSVFVGLLRMAQHHAGKLDGAVFHQKLITEILSGVPSFPATLNFEQQGLFALGYYHQREALWTKKEGPKPASAFPSSESEEENRGQHEA